MKKTGAQIVIECLKEQGVRDVFGYPGGAILGVYEALYACPEIRHTLCTHEQHAAHAADGYARASGKVGVCLATSGPGATNLLTGLCAAYMDSSPVVAITNNVARAQIGTDSFQEIDIYGVSMPVTKHNYIIKDISELADTLRDAFFIAASGRPGPVLVDIPQDITAARGEYQPRAPKAAVRKTLADELDYAGAAFLLEESCRPLLLIGGGVPRSGAEAQALALAEKIGAPIVQTLMATGCTEHSPRFAGMLGAYGSQTANALLSQCDLLIAVGTRFSERTISNPKALARHAKILHIDIDPAEINKNLTADLALIGDAREILKRLCELAAPKEPGLAPQGGLLEQGMEDCQGAQAAQGALSTRTAKSSRAAQAAQSTLSVTAKNCQEAQTVAQDTSSTLAMEDSRAALAAQDTLSAQTAEDGRATKQAKDTLPTQAAEESRAALTAQNASSTLMTQDNQGTLTPRFLLETLSRLAGKEQIYTTEVGQHQLWAAKFLGVQGHQRFLTSGGLGAMGFGLGAAIGAARATGQRIINIAGDGSFFMNMAELSTAAYYNLPILEVILDNRALGLVRQLQKNAGLHFSQVDFSRKVDYAMLARSFGIQGYTVTTRAEAERAIAEALKIGGPAVIDCRISRRQTV